MIDLRSDTVTLPGDGMREAMARAELGDDVYGEDPTINRLQERAAKLMGKEDALYVPSGSMANLVAVLTHTSSGDSVILGENAHSWLYESGAISALAGVLPIIAGEGGAFTWEDVEKNAKGGNIHMAPTTLVMMENTQNAGGGIVFPQKDVKEICENSRAWGFKTHMDGARIFNAAIATGISATELAEPMDSISFCLSKGLGAPVGSVLCGPAEFIGRGRRMRKMLGGAMRQAGVLAAAGLYALDHNVERLVEDHDHARLLGEGLVEIDGLKIELKNVQSNMVFVEMAKDGMNALEYAAKLKERGVLVNALGKTSLRAVTHLGITREDIKKAIEVFESALV